VSIGLNSKFDGDGLKKAGGRPPANICILIDISGSMGSPISYDPNNNINKLQLAGESTANLLTLLKPEDRLCVMLFNDATQVILPFTDVPKIDKAELTKQLLALKTGGGTNISRGMQKHSFFRTLVLAHNGIFTAIDDAGCKFADVDITDTRYENRVIFLTDDYPSAGTRPFWT